MGVFNHTTSGNVNEQDTRQKYFSYRTAKELIGMGQMDSKRTKEVPYTDREEFIATNGATIIINKKRRESFGLNPKRRKNREELIDQYGEEERRMLIVLLKLRERNSHSEPQVVITVTEYMKLRGLKDRKSARQEIKKTLRNLGSTSVEYEPDPKKPSATIFLFTSIIDDKKGTFIVSFSQEALALLTSRQAFTTLASNDWLLSSTRGKAALGGQIYHKMMDNKRQKPTQEQGNWLYIKTIIRVCPNLKKPEEIKGRNYRRGIGEPFFNALEWAAQYYGFAYQIQDADGREYDYSRNFNMDYFKSARVVITKWNDDFVKAVKEVTKNKTKLLPKKRKVKAK